MDVDEGSFGSLYGLNRVRTVAGPLSACLQAPLKKPTEKPKGFSCS